jgi:hypothetical protein
MTEGPVEVLLAFFDEMKAWEARAMELQKGIPIDRLADVADAKIFPRLQQIFSRYGSGRPKWEKHPDFGSPPEYDRETESVDNVEIKGNRAEITTTNHGWLRKGEMNVYVLVKVEGTWRIDQRKQVRPNGRKKSVDL